MTNDELRAEMMNGFDKVHVEFDKVHVELEELHQAIKAEGETTRRHFDLMVEQMRDSDGRS